MKSTVGLGLPDFAFNTDQAVVIIGAGLAGCAIAHTLAQRGYRCRVYDQRSAIAAATSALPAAVVRPAINGDQFFTDYFNYAFNLCCDSIEAKFFTQCGALELTSSSSGTKHTGNSPHKFISADQASKLAGTAVNDSAFYVQQAGFIKPPLLCDHWLQHKNIEFKHSTKVWALNKVQNGWQLLSNTGTVIDTSDAVVLATAQHTTAFDVAAELPIHCAAGQIDFFEYTGTPLQCTINAHGYLLPENNGVWCGASHHPLDKTNAHTDLHPYTSTPTDSLSNQARAANIAPHLAIDTSPAASFAAVRTFTPDRLPMVGALHNDLQYRKNYIDLKHGKPDHHYPPACFHEGLYVAAGLGSRGATQALLIGELISDLIAGNHLGTDHMGSDHLGTNHLRTNHLRTDHPQNNRIHKPWGRQAVQHSFLQALHPARFLLRALRRS